MNNAASNKNKAKGINFFSTKKQGFKVSLSLHIMPVRHESKDVQIFSWLTAGLLILVSLIIFVMMYV